MALHLLLVVNEINSSFDRSIVQSVQKLPWCLGGLLSHLVVKWLRSVGRDAVFFLEGFLDSLPVVSFPGWQLFVPIFGWTSQMGSRCEPLRFIIIVWQSTNLTMVANPFFSSSHGLAGVVEARLLQFHFVHTFHLLLLHFIHEFHVVL